MNRILVIGAAGMVGASSSRGWRKTVSGRKSDQRTRPCTTSVAPQPPRNAGVSGALGGIGSVAPRAGGQARGRAPERHFHLAAIVSGEAEADFERATRQSGRQRASSSSDPQSRRRLQAARRVYLFDCRFGAPFPGAIDDEFSARVDKLRHAKSHGELLLSEKTRRGGRWLGRAR